MKVTAIELTGWRNYQSQSVVMTTSPTLFVGQNGQGKTNLVEAMVYAALGRSHRTHLEFQYLHNCFIWLHLILTGKFLCWDTTKKLQHKVLIGLNM